MNKIFLRPIKTASTMEKMSTFAMSSFIHKRTDVRLFQQIGIFYACMLQICGTVTPCRSSNARQLVYSSTTGSAVPFFYCRTQPVIVLTYVENAQQWLEDTSSYPFQHGKRNSRAAACLFLRHRGQGHHHMQRPVLLGRDIPSRQDQLSRPCPYASPARSPDQCRHCRMVDIRTRARTRKIPGHS